MENQHRTRNNQVLVRFTDEELKNVRRRMILAKTMNREAFIRKMALDGFILNTDITYQEKQYYEMHKIGVNVNQIAKLANTNGSVSQKDIEVLKGMIKEIWHILRSSPSNPQ